MRTQAAAASLLAATLLFASSAEALTVTFDYTKDTSGFFTDPARRSLLDLAASTYTGFTDSLSAITPGGGNTWTATFSDPATGAQTSVVDRTIPANTVIVYVGAHALTGSTLGLGG